MKYIKWILQGIMFWLRSRGPVPETRYAVVGFDYVMPGTSAYVHRLPDTSTVMVWEAGRPATVVDSEDRVTREVVHVGADEDGEWAAITAEMRAVHKPLTADLKRAITEDTGEFDVVALLEAETASAPALVEDELGVWDPDAVDWEAPAIFREVALEALRANALSVPIAEDEFVDAIMRRVLDTGVLA